jgi:hypothetical protein
VLTSSATTITASAGAASGSATGCSLWGVNEVAVMVGANVTAASCTSGTVTLTLDELPVNFVTGGKITIDSASPSSWNGTFTATVSGSNLTYSQTCPGSAYSSSGIMTAQVGPTLLSPSAGVDHSTGFQVGHSGSQTLANGKHDYYDSNVIVLNGATFPFAGIL